MNRMPTTSPQAHASSERTDAEAALLEGLAFERLLADLSACFADVFTCDFPTKIEQSLSQVVAFLGYDRCTFAELVAGHYLDVLCSAAADGFDPLPRGRLPYQLPWFFGELRAGRIVSMASLPENLPADASAEAVHCEKVGLRSYLSIPQRIGGRVTSVLWFAAFESPRRCPPEMVARLKIVGDLLGSAMVLVRTEEDARQLRRRVWHADRVVRVSALTSAIAHQLNQPLTAILSNAQAGLKYLERKDANLQLVQDALEAVVREDKRAAETIRAMRDLLRRDDTRRESIDLAIALREILRLLDCEWHGQGIRIETRFEEGCWVLADKAQIEQVGLNLLLNAASALQSGDPAQRVVRVEMSRRAGGTIALAVRDNGRGIARGELETIFDPFWTSRQEGLGLGLAICRSIVESHNGRIWAESDPGAGTSFCVELPEAPARPRAADAPPTMHRPEVASARKSSQGIVCVVDDDPAVRESLGRVLEEVGWSVLGYGSADAFIAGLPTTDVACVVLDVCMPGLSGPELQLHLLEQACAPSIIFVTGYGGVAAGIGAMKRGASDYLEKPVDAKVLIAAVGRAVERHAKERRHALALVATKARVISLSSREREVMQHVVRGRLNKQIAADLLIAEQTVKQHRGRVMEKMGVRSVAGLVRACEAAGLLSNQPPSP
jgi:FixJ family two-component response regulator/signal transduction histidine kinase